MREGFSICAKSVPKQNKKKKTALHFELVGMHVVAFGTLHSCSECYPACSSFCQEAARISFFSQVLVLLMVLKVCGWLLKIFIKSHCSGTMKLVNAKEILHKQSGCGGAEDQHPQKLEAQVFCPLQN